MIKTQKYYESLDKRTKEYKEWVAAGKPIEVHEITDDEAKAILKTEANKVGLGDYVEKVTEATGIKSAVEHLFGEDCGCEDRKQALNRFGDKLRNVFKWPKIGFLTKKDYDWLTEYFERTTNRGVMLKEDQLKLLEIHNKVFNTKKQLSSCASCLTELRNKMLKLHNEYK